MKSLRSVLPAPRESGPGREVRVYQSETAELIEGPNPIQAHVTVAALGGLFVLLLAVAVFMRIDRVVSSSFGQIVTVEPTIVLGALDQSIIRTINIRPGQIVHKGDPLPALDPTFATADVNTVKAQVANYTAEVARCQAELAQKPFAMPPSTDPVTNTYVSAQREYFLQRKAQYDAQIRSYDEQIAQLKATIAKYQNDQARYGDRAKISKEIEEMRATLAAAQVGSRLNLLAATDQKLEIERALEFDRNAVTESQHQLDSTIATRDAYTQQWFGQVSQELVTAQGNRDNAVEQLNKANKHQAEVQISAPEDGMVLTIAKLSPGSVLNSGDALIYLAPLKSPLEAEIRIATRDVGFVRVGDDTTIKLDAYDYIEHGTASGQVRSVSEGAFTTDDNGTPVDPYYKVRVKLDPLSLRNVPAHYRLVPGSTLAADIHVGSRSLFNYLLAGLARGFDQAMREP